VNDFYKVIPVTIQQFGSIPLSRGGSVFINLAQLTISPTTIPVILPNTSFGNLFLGCTDFNSNEININIPDNGPASVYPITFTVTGITTIQNITLTLNNYYHSYHYSSCSPFQKNMKRVAIQRFTKTLRHKLLRAVRICFDEFNEQGGAIVRMQDKNLVYFPRACIYAIYADQPAATKCALTGSSCPVCYTKQSDMASAQTRNLVYRWDADMAMKKRNYKNIIMDNI
jgi:hypothetical protein